MKNLYDYDVYQRQQVTLHCKITTLSPLSHIGEVQGNVSNLKTAKRIDMEGNPRSFFLYSGNALRNGILRRRGTASSLSDLGLTVNRDVHHTLFCGGRIDGSTANDMALDKKIRQLMPWLSVLGTAKPAGVFGNKEAQMVQGRLGCGSAYLLCYETADLIFNEFPGLVPPEVAPRLQAYLDTKAALSSNPFAIASPEQIESYQQAKKEHLPYIKKQLRTWTEYLTTDQTTRRDSTQATELLKFLPEANPLQLLAEQATKNPKKDKSQQMIASDFLIMSGATLYSRWDLNCTDVELGWVVNALLKFAESPYMGGKSNRGNGLVDLDLWYQQGKTQCHFLGLSTGTQQISEAAQNAKTAYDGYLSAYREFLESAKDSQDIRGLFDAKS